MTTVHLPGVGLPRLLDSVLVAEPPASVVGAWAGGPSALEADGWVYLAYRLRRPVGEGRGFRNVVARSRDGVRFETVAVVERSDFDAESLERPCLVRTPEGRWRLYVSSATPGTKHWRVDAAGGRHPSRGSEGPRPDRAAGRRHAAPSRTRSCCTHDGQWHLWASVHPLESWDDADRMTTDYATSPDGVRLDLARDGARAAPRAAGTRAACGSPRSPSTATGSARPTTAAPARRRTGRSAPGSRRRRGSGRPLRRRGGGGAGRCGRRTPAAGCATCRAAPCPTAATGCTTRSTRPDGAHELRTEVVA